MTHPFRFALLILLTIASVSPSVAQDEQKTKQRNDTDVTTTEVSESPPEPPAKVNVGQVVQDEDIALRLRQILDATGWFTDATVKVEDGVVFLTGQTDSAPNKTWAGELASKTEDVVAVVNRIKVTDPPIWNIQPAIAASRDLGRNAVQSLPLLVIALAIGIITFFATRLVVAAADRTILKRVKSSLLREVARKAMMVPVWLVGIYLMLRLSGLTQLAMTVVGGTGVIGLIAGFAFRDIAENFLSSILISVQNPFRYGDLIEVEGHLGYVQRVNTRGTLLMTFDGNHIQIPNSTIYKNTIKNYSSNPNRRFDFVVGIGYDVPVSEAQEVAFEVLSSHPAILDDPEPQILVEELGSSTVNLRIFAWVDAGSHSWAKVKSSVIRLVKSRFEEAGYSMPDDAREIVFPESVPVRMLPKTDEANGDGNRLGSPSAKPRQPKPENVASKAEGGFDSEQKDIEEQARKSRDPEEGGAEIMAANSANG